MALVGSRAIIVIILLAFIIQSKAREAQQQRHISGWILQLQTPPSNVSELLNCSQSLCGPEPRGYVPDQHTSRRDCANFCFADLFCRQYLLIASTPTDEEDEVRGKCVLLPIVCEIAGTVGCTKHNKAFVVTHLPKGYALITEAKQQCVEVKPTRPGYQAGVAFKFRGFGCAPALSSYDRILLTTASNVYLEGSRSPALWHVVLRIRQFRLFNEYINERSTFETVVELLDNRDPRRPNLVSRTYWSAAMRTGNGSLFISEQSVSANTAPAVFYVSNGSLVRLKADKSTKHPRQRSCQLVPVTDRDSKAAVYLVCKIRGDPCQRQILVVRNATLQQLATPTTLVVCEVQQTCPISAPAQFDTLRKSDTFRDVACAEPNHWSQLGQPVAAYANGRLVVAPQPFIVGDLPSKLPRDNESNRRWILSAKCANICWRRIVYEIIDPENPTLPPVTVTKEFGEQDVGFLSFLFRHHRSIVADEYGNVLVSMLVATNYDPFSGEFFVQTELYLFDQRGRYVENLTKYYENYVPFSIPIAPMPKEAHDVLSSPYLPEPSRIEMHKLWADQGKALLWTAEINAQNALDWRLQIIEYLEVAKKK